MCLGFPELKCKVAQTKEVSRFSCDKMAENLNCNPSIVDRQFYYRIISGVVTFKNVCHASY